jgi:hypothetical protein
MFKPRIINSLDRRVMTISLATIVKNAAESEGDSTELTLMNVSVGKGNNYNNHNIV